MRRALHFILLFLSLSLAILATAFHRPIHAFDPLRRFTLPQFTLGKFTCVMGLNDSGGFSIILTHNLDSSSPCPSAITPSTGVYTPNELLMAHHAYRGFVYARINAAAAAFLPLNRIVRIFVLPYWFMLITFLAYPVLWSVS